MNEGLVIKAIKNSIYSLSKDLKTTFLTQPSSINEASLGSRRNYGNYVCVFTKVGAEVHMCTTDLTRCIYERKCWTLLAWT